MSGVEQDPIPLVFTPYTNILESVKLLWLSVWIVAKKEPYKFDLELIHEYTKEQKRLRLHYLDQVTAWQQALFIKRETLSKAERRAHKAEFEKTRDFCNELMLFLATPYLTPVKQEAVPIKHEAASV